jgi:hypothetical protein
MVTEEIKYSDDELNVAIVVGKANNRMGARHSALLEETQAWCLAHPDEDENEQAVRWTFTVVASATVSVSGIPWPMTADQFMDMVPEPLSMQWFETAQRLNQHWWKQPGDKDDQKKVTTSM